MAAIDEHFEQTLTVREAAAVCHVRTGTIRGQLSDGAFPNAFKLKEKSAASDGPWRIPLVDLERAGFAPDRAADARLRPVAAAPAASGRVDRGRKAQLRAELADAVAELGLMRGEMEKRRAVATERDRALERADAALKALSETINELAPVTPSVDNLADDDVPTVARHPAPGLAAIPPDVRDAAIRYTKALAASPRAATPRGGSRNWMRSNGSAKRPSRDSDDGERLLWIWPPENTDTPEDCAAWFVNRMTVALLEAEEKGAIHVRSSDLRFLEDDASEMSGALLRKVGKLLSRVSAVLEATLTADTVAARTAGLLDTTSGLPLAWTMNHSRALDADPYPVAAQVAAVAANLDNE